MALIPGTVAAHAKDTKTPEGPRTAAETYTKFLQEIGLGKGGSRPVAVFRSPR